MKSRLNQFGFNELMVGDISPEKAGVGGSIPSLATIESVTYRPPDSQFHSNSFQFQKVRRTLPQDGSVRLEYSVCSNRAGFGSVRLDQELCCREPQPTGGPCEFLRRPAPRTRCS